MEANGLEGEHEVEVEGEHEVEVEDEDDGEDEHEVEVEDEDDGEHEVELEVANEVEDELERVRQIALDPDGYAAIGIDFAEVEWIRPEPNKPPPALAKIGRAIMRLRLYWQWSQNELAIRSGVDQSTISRLERGMQRGMSIRRLARILEALGVGEVIFDKPAAAPQTALEVMLYGDGWARAEAEADRRLGWTAQSRDPG